MFLSFVNHFPTQGISFLVKSIQSHWHNLVVEIRSVGHFHADVIVGKAVHQRLARRGMFEQHRPRGADEPAVEVAGLLCRECEDTLTALVLLLRRDHMRDFQGFGARTFGVGEHVILRHIHALHEVVCLLEVFFRLATGADDDIHANKSIGHYLTNLLYLMAEQRRVVLPVHEPQHLVASTLQGDVEMWHERSRLGTILDDFVRKQVRLDAGDAVAFDALHLVECLHEVEEGLTCRTSKIADVHPRDDNLLATLLHHLQGLLHQRGNAPVAASSTGNRDGAISTIVVATILHLEEV